MGFSYFHMKVITKHIDKIPRKKRCLFLGNQEIFFTAEQLIKEINQHRKSKLISYESNKEVLSLRENLSVNEKYADRGFMACGALGNLYGFDECVTVDYTTDLPRVDFEHDLNKPGLSEVTGGDFDLIYDGGTLEHLFHIPNALENFLQSLAVGGRIIHSNPMNNCMNHGFYQFSPIFYHELYTSNNCEVVYSARMREEIDGSNAEISPMPAIEITAEENHRESSIFIAEKKEEFTSLVIPQQKHYKKIWKHFSDHM